MYRKNRGRIRRCLPNGGFSCPPPRNRVVERHERARWEALEENFLLLKGVQKYRTGNVLLGETAQRGQVVLMDLEAGGSLQTCVLFSDLDLPDFRVASRGGEAGAGVPGSLEGDDEEIGTDDEAFDDRFQVAGDDEIAVQELFTPPIRRHLLRSPAGLMVEVKNGFLLACWPGFSWGPGDYPPRYGRIQNLVDLLAAGPQVCLAA